MSKPRSPAFDFSVYILIRFVVTVLQALPVAWCTGIAQGLGRLLHAVNRRHRAVARDNLRHAFGANLSDAALDQTVRGVYFHFSRMLLEIIHAPRRLRPHNWRRHIELVGGRQIVDSLLSDRPLLIVTGHFGNWEIAGFALGLLGFKTYAVARTLDNPHLDDYLRQFREKTGQKLLDKRGDLDKMQDILAAGGVVATLADQDAGQRGLYVDFFGRPASTHKAIALLALEHKTPLLVTTTANRGRFLDYAICLDDRIMPEEYDGRPGAVKEITARFSKALENGIRRAPEQYFWLHRRWKHQPAPRRRVA
jgi:Kdo2-lipid IVA lauroyltransferase/acyltransferase